MIGFINDFFLQLHKASKINQQLLTLLWHKNSKPCLMKYFYMRY